MRKNRDNLHIILMVLLDTVVRNTLYYFQVDLTKNCKFRQISALILLKRVIHLIIGNNGKGCDLVMAVYANIEIDVFSLVLLLILFFNMRRNTREYLPDQKLFVYMLISTGALLILDIIQWLLDGKLGVGVFYTNLICAGIYLIIQIFPCKLWCYYVRYQLSMDVKKTMKASKLLHIPLFVNTASVLLSYFYGFYFYIDANNYYHRGEFFWIFSILFFSYFVYAFIFIIANRKKTERKIFISLLTFPLLPLAGSFIQVAFFGISLIWPCVTISLVMLYINIQKNQLYTDHLTGLYNRRLLDIHLDSCLKQNGPAAKIAVIMLDIDGFKSINDKFGHMIGDRALVETANVLKKSVGISGFTARYGGDEFVVVMPVKTFSDIKNVVKNIDSGLEQLNAKEDAMYLLHLSKGYEVFDCIGAYNRLDVLCRIDRHMYDDKLRSEFVPIH